jgi:hypothetical protein
MSHSNGISIRVAASSDHRLGDSGLEMRAIFLFGVPPDLASTNCHPKQVVQCKVADDLAIFITSNINQIEQGAIFADHSVHVFKVSRIEICLGPNELLISLDDEVACRVVGHTANFIVSNERAPQDESGLDDRPDRIAPTKGQLMPNRVGAFADARDFRVGKLYAQIFFRNSKLRRDMRYIVVKFFL